MISGPEGGETASLGDQEPVGRDAQAGVMMEAAPASPLVVAEPDFLFEFLVVPLDAPAQFRPADQLGQGRLWRQGREPVLGRRILDLRPLDQEPLLGTRLVSQFIPMRRARPHGRKARGQ